MNELQKIYFDIQKDFFGSGVMYYFFTGLFIVFFVLRVYFHDILDEVFKAVGPLPLYAMAGSILGATLGVGTAILLGLPFIESAIVGFVLGIIAVFAIDAYLTGL